MSMLTRSLFSLKVHFPNTFSLPRWKFVWAVIPGKTPGFPSPCHSPSPCHPLPEPIPMDFYGSMESRAQIRLTIRIPSSSARLTGTLSLMDCVVWMKQASKRTGGHSISSLLSAQNRKREGVPAHPPSVHKAGAFQHRHFLWLRPKIEACYIYPGTRPFPRLLPTRNPRGLLPS